MAMPVEETELRPALALRPVQPRDRIFQLDMLRGWAILGILAVNAVSFAWPIKAEMGGGDAFGHVGADAWGQWAVDIFFHDKFRSLFSMLFGVSIFLVGGERSDAARGRLLRSRLFWLAAIALIHGLGVWYGDILLHYAYCGVAMLTMRSWSGRRLLLVGGGLTLFFSLIATAGPVVSHLLGPEFHAQMEANTPRVTLEAINASVAAYKAGDFAPWVENAKAWVTLQGLSLVLAPVTLALMMTGLGLYKTGFLVGRSPTAIYLIVFALGVAVLGVSAWANLPGRDPATLPIAGLDEASRGMAPLITVAYAAMLILMARFGLKIVTGRLAPVGRMAFTNYLTQSLIMASLFYLPWGPQWIGLYGPAAQWSVVGAIWIVQLVWSPLWLSVFAMGPLEWIWRCLTYGRIVPLRAGSE